MSRSQITRTVVCCLAFFASSSFVSAQQNAISQITVPQGDRVEVAAESPLVQHPLMGSFDEQGRLYIAATAGMNLKRPELEAQLPNFVQRLEDVDGDGKFDKATVFADKLTFPQGCLWWRGSLFVASSGAIWKFTDTNDDGVADERVKLVGDFGYTGNAADIHGPFAGPDNRIYWCDGRHGHEIKDENGDLISKGKAARIFSCREDGSDVQTWCSGGMDNPVEVTFLPRGEMLGTVNLFYSRPRGDCLVQWQYGGVYPRFDFAESNQQEFIRTGPLLTEVHNFGHVAVSGLCRLEKESKTRETILVTEFNANRVVCVTLDDSVAPMKVELVEDYFVSADHDFHPTDVMQDADGSILVINTGGWFLIGCPQSQVEKSQLHGGIYRVRNTSAKAVTDPRGLKLNWKNPQLAELFDCLGDSRPAVQERAMEALAAGLKKSTSDAELLKLNDRVANAVPAVKMLWTKTLARVETPAALELIVRLTEDSNSDVQQLAVRCLLYARPLDQPVAERLFMTLLKQLESGTPAIQTNALATLGRQFGKRPGFAATLLEAKNVSLETPDCRHAFVYALIASDDREAVGKGVFHKDEAVRLAATDAITALRLPKINAADQVWLEIPAAGSGLPLSDADKAQLQKIAAELAEGDVSRGKGVFASEKTSCIKCHSIRGQGGQVGPDLSTIGRSRGKLDLLEAVLFPSASFARGFAPYLVATEDGHVYSGIVLAETATHVRLGLNKDQSVEVPVADVEEIKAADASIMPNDVVKQLTIDELADLLSYLQSLK